MDNNTTNSSNDNNSDTFLLKTCTYKHQHIYKVTTQFSKIVMLVKCKEKQNVITYTPLLTTEYRKHQTFQARDFAT